MSVFGRLPNAAEAEFRLDQLQIINPYIPYVRRARDEALAVHAQGDDLRDFLTATPYCHPRHNQPVRLADKYVELVVAGREQPEGFEDYDGRFGYAVEAADTSTPMGSTVGWGGQFWKSYDELWRYARKGKYSWAGWVQGSGLTPFTGHAMKALGISLDTAFDHKGRRLDQLDTIAMTMVRLGLQLPDITLASYYAGQVTGLDNRADIYLTAPNGTIEGEAAQAAVSDVRTELEPSPRSLCRFLVRQLEHDPDANAAENSYGVSVLLREPKLFLPSERYALRAALLASLMRRRNYRVIDQFLNAAPSELALLRAAEQDESSGWKQKLELSRLKTRITALVAEATERVDYSMKDFHALRHEEIEEGLPVLSLTTPEALTGKSIDELCVQYGPDKSAEALIEDLMADKYITAVEKLAGAVAIAGSFRSETTEGLNPENIVAAQMELLVADFTLIQAARGVVEKTEMEQALRQRLDGLRNEIASIANHALRDRYTTQLDKLAEQLT